MRPPIVVRDARPDDAAAIADAHAEAWRAGYAGLFAPADLATAVATRRTSWDAERVRRMSTDGHHLLVADDGAVCGFLHTVPGLLAGFYVHPRAWGTAAAPGLLAEGLARMPPGPVRLDTLAGAGRARSFYEKHGFVATGREADHDFGDGLTGRVVEYVRQLP